jgi:Protein of unknown function (DUF1588)/Protein of unknown function (DUF1592)/Protein of unknown function (DUF1595)/Protein of unknown function (DUF1587)/Protein of unknown function (DUF1585)
MTGVISKPSWRIMLGLLGVGWVGCQDAVDIPADAPPSVPPSLIRPGSEPPPSVVEAPATVRRLTREEYRNSIFDLFGFDATAATTHLALDTAPDGLRTDVSSQLHSEAGTEGYARAAEEIASAIPWTGRLSLLADCDREDPNCQTTFVKRLGRLLMQRPLADETAAIYVGLFKAAKDEQLDFEAGTRLVLRAMLQSPGFLFVTGPTTSDRRIDPYTLASRLTLFLWKSIPDAEMVSRTDAGAFSDARALSSTVSVMLDDPRASRGVRAFAEDWLKLHTLVLRSPPPNMGFPSTLYEDMREETLALIERLAFTKDAPILDMFVDRKTTLPLSIAALYGYESSGPSSAVFDLSNDPKRAGILTHPGFLALSAEGENTTLVRRGLSILRTFLCEDIPAPPQNAAVLFALLPESLSERERFKQHSLDPACSSCHQIFDPLGYAFEPYDGLGRHRFVDEHGNVLRQDGTITLDGATHDFQTVSGFAAILGQSQTVKNCIVTRVFSYALSRKLSDADLGMVQGLSQAFSSLPLHQQTWTALFEQVANHPSLQLGESVP